MLGTVCSCRHSQNVAKDIVTSPLAESVSRRCYERRPYSASCDQKQFKYAKALNYITLEPNPGICYSHYMDYYPVAVDPIL